MNELEQKLFDGGFDIAQRTYIIYALEWLSSVRPPQLQAEIGAFGFVIIDEILDMGKPK